MKIYKKIIEIIETGEKASLCTVIATKGSTPRGIGSKMIVTKDKKIFGSIGGGVLEGAITEKAINVMNTAIPELVSYNLSKDLNMTCGGAVDVFIEPLANKFPLIIFGAGHIGKALTQYLINLDFTITIVDEREGIFDGWEAENCIKINRSYTAISEKLPSNTDTFIVIVTNSHLSDKEILKQYINGSFSYIGLIGSKRKVAEIKHFFLSENIATIEQLEKIDMPIGMEISAEGPDEIAISIASKLIYEKNRLRQNPKIED